VAAGLGRTGLAVISMVPAWIILSVMPKMENWLTENQKKQN
jgi:uncharacterized membrane protein YhiD involved in acid resistance